MTNDTKRAVDYLRSNAIVSNGRLYFNDEQKAREAIAALTASGRDSAAEERAVERVAKVLACANSSVDKEYDPELLWKCLDDRARAHWLRLARAALAAAGGKL